MTSVSKPALHAHDAAGNAASRDVWATLEHSGTSGPLTGIRVVELGRYIAAPYAGRLLAGLGATVVKVEAPGTGDPMRHWESGGRPYSPQFAAYNLGKSGVTLNLRDPDDAADFLTLTDSADAVIENFRPGVMDRLGLSAETLMKRNPRLIYCAVTGFGADGPYASRPTYDTVVSAMSGLYSLLFPVDSGSPVGPAMSDLLAGMFASQGILAALQSRHATGHGQVVDVSMLGAVLGFLGEPITSAAESGRPIAPNTRQRRAQAYSATSSDGKSFIVHLSVPEKFWEALCSAMDRPDWTEDPRLQGRQKRFENYRLLEELIRQQAATRTRDEWFARFIERDLPHAPLNTVLDVVDDEQVRHMGLAEGIDMGDGPPMTVIANPIRFSRTPTGTPSAAPNLGADNEALSADDAGDH